MSTRAIETRYAGHLFRSRLEARWAALFDLVGWEWVYEPFDGAGYVPDFLLEGDYPVLVEVKPEPSVDNLKPHVEKVEAGLPDWNGDVLIVGLTPAMESAYHAQNGNAALGLLGEGQPRAWDEAAWRFCGLCTNPAFGYTVDVAANTRPCGHDGSGRAGPMLANLKELWGQAHEATRWSP